MTKVEYIEKYGEEAWKKRCENNRAYMKKWHSLNSKKEKQYREQNKSIISERSKKWKEENKEYVKIRDKKYRDNNPRTEYFIEYRKKNKEKLLKDNYVYRSQTKRGRAVSIMNKYNGSDKCCGFDPSNNVTSKWIVDNIFSGQSCIYCGESDWTRLGCDRIDNSKPHTPDNVVCACGLCNMERADKYSVEEFKQYRALHPRACDIPKAPALQLSETGALKKRTVL